MNSQSIQPAQSATVNSAVQSSTLSPGNYDGGKVLPAVAATATNSGPVQTNMQSKVVGGGRRKRKSAKKSRGHGKKVGGKSRKARKSRRGRK